MPPRDVACDICGGRFFPSSLPFHRKQCAKTFMDRQLKNGNGFGAGDPEQNANANFASSLRGDTVDPNSFFGGGGSSGGFYESSAIGTVNRLRQARQAVDGGGNNVFPTSSGAQSRQQHPSSSSSSAKMMNNPQQHPSSSSSSAKMMNNPRNKMEVPSAGRSARCWSLEVPTLFGPFRGHHVAAPPCGDMGRKRGAWADRFMGSEMIWWPGSSAGTKLLPVVFCDRTNHKNFQKKSENVGE